jgi:glutaredoxin
MDDRHYGAAMSKLKKSLEALRKTVQAFQAPVEPKEKETLRGMEHHEPLTFSYGDPRKPAQVFGTRSCSFTHRALYLLEDEEIETTFVDLGEPGAGAIRRELTAETGQTTVPYVYLWGKFVGGFRELDQIHRAGELQGDT